MNTGEWNDPANIWVLGLELTLAMAIMSVVVIMVLARFKDKGNG